MSDHLAKVKKAVDSFQLRLAKELSNEPIEQFAAIVVVVGKDGGRNVCSFATDDSDQMFGKIREILQIAVDEANGQSTLLQ